jgi:hypothetical protein
MRAFRLLPLSVAVLLCACGGGEAGGGSDGPTAPRQASPQAGAKAAAPGVPTSKGGDNSIQTWGVEGSGEERARLGGIVRAYLEARARGDWAEACARLAAEQRQAFARLTPRGRGNAACAEAMRKLANQVPAGAFVRESEIVDVLSLRVGGGRAFLIYTRPGGKVYATALIREAGAWKVVSVSPATLAS